MPRRFYQRNNFEGSLFSFTKSAVLSHFKIGGFVSFSKSAVLSHFQNRRFCLNFKIGGFVSISKSAVLFHLKSAVLSCPRRIQIREQLNQCSIVGARSMVLNKITHRKNYSSKRTPRLEVFLYWVTLWIISENDGESQQIFLCASTRSDNWWLQSHD